MARPGAAAAAAFLRDVRLSRRAWLPTAAADGVAGFKRPHRTAESGPAGPEANALRPATDPRQRQAA